MKEIPLIEDQRPQELPLEIQTWLDPLIPLPQDVQYKRDHIPMHYFFDSLVVLVLFGIGLLFFTTMIIRLISNSMTIGHLIVFLISIHVFWGATLWFIFIAIRNHRLRKAHQQESTRAGYLWNDDIFLSFDGQKVWLIPKKIIISVVISNDIKRKSSGIRFRHDNDVVLYQIYDRETLRQIQRWLNQDNAPKA